MRLLPERLIGTYIIFTGRLSLGGADDNMTRFVVYI